MLRKVLSLVFAIFAAAWMMGCSHVAQPAVDLAAEESAIRTTDAQWLAAAQARDAEKAASFWSDDATIVAPNSPLRQASNQELCHRGIFITRFLHQVGD
jgi:hypothetical protein